MRLLVEQLGAVDADLPDVGGVLHHLQRARLRLDVAQAQDQRAQRVGQRREGRRRGEVVVFRQLGQPAGARAVGRHPAGEAGELEEELGRVEDVLRQHVREAGTGGVGELQHQQVLDAAAGAAEHHAAVRLGDAVEAGDDLLQQLGVGRHRGGDERRRQEAVGERHAAVGAQAGQAGDRQRGVAAGVAPGRQQHRGRAGDLDLLRLAAAGHRVAHPLDRGRGSARRTARRGRRRSWRRRASPAAGRGARRRRRCRGRWRPARAGPWSRGWRRACRPGRCRGRR